MYLDLLCCPKTLSSERVSLSQLVGMRSCTLEPEDGKQSGIIYIICIKFFIIYILTPFFRPHIFGGSDLSVICCLPCMKTAVRLMPSWPNQSILSKSMWKSSFVWKHLMSNWSWHRHVSSHWMTLETSCVDAPGWSWHFCMQTTTRWCLGSVACVFHKEKVDHVWQEPETFHEERTE